MAHISFVGYIGADPELRASTSGGDVVTFRVAERKRGAQKDEAPQWFRCVAFGNFGTKVIYEYARKGTRAYIVGDLQERTWVDKDKRTQRNYEVIVSHFEIISSPVESDEESEETEAEDLNPPA